MRFVLGRLLRLSGLCRFFKIQQEGYQLRFFPSNASYSLWINLGARERELSLLRAYLREGDRVIDVGANIGDTALTASLRVGALGHIHAFEPHPRIFGYLGGNLELNGVTNVTVHNLAVGACHGRVAFSDRSADDMNQVLAVGGDMEVEMVSLDEFFTEPAPVQLLKVDVEGYEKVVLDGAGRLLRSVECVYFEVGLEGSIGVVSKRSDLLDLLLCQGFALFRVAACGTLCAIGRDYQSASVENLVALRDVGDFVRRTDWSVEGGAQRGGDACMGSQQS